MKKTTGQLIRKKRAKKGMTQAELAKAVGVSAQSIWYWEKGIKHPRNAHCAKLAKVLGIGRAKLAFGN